MDTHERLEIMKKREYMVVKSNDLIQKNRFDLTLAEQKAIAYICSMIKPVEKNAPFQLTYEFNIREYCKVCGFAYNNGKNYKDIKATLKNLADKSMWLDNGSGEILVRWLSRVQINKKYGTVIVDLDNELVPYLFDLGKKFYQYHLSYITGMKSSFSPHIYELLKSVAYMKTCIMDIDTLKELLMIQNVKSYQNFAIFKIKVLEVALKEINEQTDINVTYTPLKKGKKFDKIEFCVTKKNTYELFCMRNNISNE